MKTLYFLLAVAAMALLAVSCGSKKPEAPKVLVLYYSQTGNTQTVAEAIAAKLGADIEAIQAVNPYDGTYQETIERCLVEREQGTVAQVLPIVSDIASYDIIFLGYPVWFGTYAPPVAGWLENVDLSGKKVVPFCTFGSGGLDSSVKDLEAKQPGATVLPGYGVRAARMAAVPQEIDQFLKAGGFMEGEFVKLDAFPEQQPVTEEEAAIFDAAVKDYPMMSAKAVTAASRALPNGVEYLFTAVNVPREGAPKPAPKQDSKQPPMQREMKVYVTVVEGEAPVFTQVVR